VELLDQLAQIGFTDYEAKVYLALLAEYPATGYQISKRSGVPRSMVYETLSRLHGRGLVLEAVEGRATLYRPLPPQTFLDERQSEHQRLLDSLRAGLGKLYNQVIDDRIWSIRGRRAALAYASQLLQRADSDVFLVLTDDDLKPLHDEIVAACERGLETNVLLTGQGSLDCGRVAHHPPLESELQGLTGLLLVAVENGEALIASTGAQHEMRATVTRNPDLAFIARQFVWMELFTQRIYARLGPELLDRLDDEDRQIFESLASA
jgi:sugar-specific transcriptional regulator TrmB